MSHAVDTFADHILFQAKMKPQAPAILLPNETVTYGDMAQAISVAERRIAALGLPEGGLCCIIDDNHVATMILSAALFRNGHPILILSKIGMAEGLEFPLAAIFHGPGQPMLIGQRQVLVSPAWLDDDKGLPPLSPSKGFSDDNAICGVFLSSGTTGRPKARSILHSSFRQRLHGYQFSLGQRAWSRLLLSVGLSSCWGFSTAAHCLSIGKAFVGTSNAGDSVIEINRLGVDLLVLSTLHLRELVHEQMRSQTTMPSLKNVFFGGGLATPDLLRSAKASVCETIITQYGSTEAGATAIAPVELLQEEGTVGFVAPWSRVEITNGDGEDLGHDCEGLVRIWEPRTAPYPPGIADASFKDGWFYPGDVGMLRPDGMLLIRGRNSEMINAGGLKISPESIENMVSQHPNVSGVAAFSLTGDFGLEDIGLAVTTRTAMDSAHLIAWCKERNLQIARVFIVDTLPRSSSGKILRQTVKSRLNGAM